MRLARTAAPPPRYVQVWPAGVEPAVSGSRSRRGGRLAYGQMKSSGGRARTCASRLTVARLAARQHRNEGGRRGTRTLNGRSRTRFRDGMPRPWQPFQVAPAGVEPAPCRLRVGSSAALSYGAKEGGRQESNLRRVAFQATALPS